MSRSSRKWEHVQYALSTGQSGKHGLSDIRFIPNSLPNISYGNISLNSYLGAFPLASPIIINAMTGGAKQTAEINRKLAIIARERNLALAVGSQMAALREPDLAYSYQVVRRENPKGLIFANLGAEATVDQGKRAVEMLSADALQIHLNVMQELVMPEGDRDFSGYLGKIEQMARQLPVPVIVKEVGFGMSRRTLRQLRDAGVTIIDIGGSGGTNFVKVENQRRDRPLTMFEEWGLTTAQSLLEAGEAGLKHGVSLVASGGIRHGLDIAKAISLGASAVGMAGYFLRLVHNETLDECLFRVDQLHHELRLAMTALGTASFAELQNAALTVCGETAEWAHQRGIDLSRYALRGE